MPLFLCRFACQMMSKRRIVFAIVKVRTRFCNCVLPSFRELPCLIAYADHSGTHTAEGHKMNPWEQNLSIMAVPMI